MAIVDDKSRPVEVLVKHAAASFVQPTPRGAQLQHPFRVQQYHRDTHIPLRKVSKTPVDNRADGAGMPVIDYGNPAFFLPPKPAHPGDGGGGGVTPPNPDLHVVSAVVAGRTLTLTLGGGTAPYSIRFGDGSSGVEGDGPVFTHTYTIGGEFDVDVSDDNSGSLTETVNIPPAGPLTFVSGVLRKSVFGSRTGEFTFSGGAWPLTLSWLPADALINNQVRSSSVDFRPVVDVFSMTLTDHLGATLVVPVDYTGLANDSEKPLTIP